METRRKISRLLYDSAFKANLPCSNAVWYAQVDCWSTGARQLCRANTQTAANGLPPVLNVSSNNVHSQDRTFNL